MRPKGVRLKLHLHTAINKADFVSRCMLYTYKVTKYIREKMTLYTCTFVGEPLNRIHQDTKSARLIAVCKHSLRGVRLRYVVVKYTNLHREYIRI